MPQRIRPGHSSKGLPVHPEEGPSGTGQQQTLYLPPVSAAHQALINGGMLRIHRNDLCPVLLRLRHDQLSGADQCFLVGKPDPFAFPDCRKRRLQTYHPHCGGNYTVRLRQGRCRNQPRLTEGNLRGQTGNAFRQGFRRLPGRHDRKCRTEPPALLGHPFHTGSGSQGSHTDLGQVREHIQSLPPDGAGGAEDTNTFYHGTITLIPPWASKESALPSGALPWLWNRTGPGIRRDRESDSHSP